MLSLKTRKSIPSRCNVNPSNVIWISIRFVVFTARMSAHFTNCTTKLIFVFVFLSFESLLFPRKRIEFRVFGYISLPARRGKMEKLFFLPAPAPTECLNRKWWSKKKAWPSHRERLVQSFSVMKSFLLDTFPARRKTEKLLFGCLERAATFRARAFHWDGGWRRIKAMKEFRAIIPTDRVLCQILREEWAKN